MRSKIKWPNKRHDKPCVMHGCKRSAMRGGAWCFQCLKENLESARRLLRTWRVTSKRQDAILMAKVNKTVAGLHVLELEDRAEESGETD